MPNGINWQQVRADFNDTNNAMRTGIGAISQAGTVFGELRKSILDQEQREIDNAYREKKFNEDVRQFGLKQALDEDRFRENIRQFGLNYDLASDRNAEIARHNRAVEANSKAMLGIQSDIRKLQLQEHLQKQQKAGYDRAVQAMLYGSPAQQFQARTEAAKSSDPMLQNLAQAAAPLSFFDNPTDAQAAALNLRAMYDTQAANELSKQTIERQNKAIELQSKIDAKADKERDDLRKATKDANPNDVNTFESTTDPTLKRLWSLAAPNSKARINTGHIFERLNEGSKGFAGTIGNWFTNNQFDILSSANTGSGMSDSQFNKIISAITSGAAFSGDTTVEERNTLVKLLKGLRDGNILPDGSINQLVRPNDTPFVGPIQPSSPYQTYDRQLLFGE